MNPRRGMGRRSRRGRASGAGVGLVDPGGQLEGAGGGAKVKTVFVLVSVNRARMRMAQRHESGQGENQKEGDGKGDDHGREGTAFGIGYYLGSLRE